MPLLTDRSFQRNIMEQGQTGREEVFQPSSYIKPLLLQVFLIQKNLNLRRMASQNEVIAHQQPELQCYRAAGAGMQAGC